MGNKKNTLFLIILSAILASLLLALSIYSYLDYRKERINEKELVREKKIIEKELAELIDNYENITELNKEMSQHFLEAKERIGSLLRTIRENKPKIRLLIKFRRDMEMLKNEKLTLFRLNDSLKKVNSKIKEDFTKQTEILNQKNIALNKSDNLRKMLINENKKLVSLVESGRKLVFKNIEGKGIRVRNSGKKIATVKAKKVELFQICFKLKGENELIRENKTIYLHLFNPEGELITDKSNTTKFAKYSMRKQVFFENRILNICMTMPALKGDILPGIYKIKLYQDDELKGTSEFELK